MNLSVNGQSQVPPGFRFHPTEEELLHYYLKKKVANQKIDLDVIQDVDLNKLEPWDIQEKCRIGSAPQTDWYFFSHKDKKYPTGIRTNRATTTGFWKATGRDKIVRGTSNRIGTRKTLVFYKGRAPHGEKSDWIMHEYRLDDNTHDQLNMPCLSGDQLGGGEEGWVVCRVFLKGNYVKAPNNPPERSSDTSIDTHMISSKTHDLDQEQSKNKNTIGYVADRNNDDKFVEPMIHTDKMDPNGSMHLPELDIQTEPMINYQSESHHHHPTSTLNWVEIDRLVAYQLNEQTTEASESTNRQTLSGLTNDNDIAPLYLAAGHDSTSAAVNATTFQDLIRPDQFTSPNRPTYVYDYEPIDVPTYVYDYEPIDDQLRSFTKQSTSSSSLGPMSLLGMNYWFMSN